MSHPQPIVSVLVPCFDKQPYVAETLDSALAQSLAGVELIVVDDGSTDGSCEVLRGYEDRARVLYEPNRGARERGGSDQWALAGQPAQEPTRPTTHARP